VLFVGGCGFAVCCFGYRVRQNGKMDKQKQQNLDNFLKNNHINNNSNSINTNPKK
jgi:hypothetical protein